MRLHPEVIVSVTVNIARSNEEAAIQARGESVEEVAEAKLDEREEAVVNVFESTADVDVEELEQVAAGEIDPSELDAEPEEKKDDA